MARITASVFTSHVPAIGAALDLGKTQEDYWKPVFAGYDFSRQWMKDNPPDVIFLVFNDHATAFSLEMIPTFAIGTAARGQGGDRGQFADAAADCAGCGRSGEIVVRLAHWRAQIQRPVAEGSRAGLELGQLGERAHSQRLEQCLHQVMPVPTVRSECGVDDAEMQILIMEAQAQPVPAGKMRDAGEQPIAVRRRAVPSPVAAGQTGAVQQAIAQARQGGGVRIGEAQCRDHGADRRVGVQCLALSKFLHRQGCQRLGDGVPAEGRVDRGRQALFQIPPAVRAAPGGLAADHGPAGHGVAPEAARGAHRVNAGKVENAERHRNAREGKTAALRPDKNDFVEGVIEIEPLDIARRHPKHSRVPQPV